VRSGDWKLVSQRGRIELFDLSKDTGEQNDLARQMPEKVAELTRLHDAWLAGMPNPVKAGAKRWGMPAPESSSAKKTRRERKRNR
jgi:hypothetical protein